MTFRRHQPSAVWRGTSDTACWNRSSAGSSPATGHSRFLVIEDGPAPAVEWPRWSGRGVTFVRSEKETPVNHADLATPEWPVAFLGVPSSRSLDLRSGRGLRVRCRRPDTGMARILRLRVGRTIN